MIEWRILISVILALVLIQAMKILWRWLHKESIDWNEALADGGVVSAHMGIVSALCFSIYFAEGLSNLFFACVVFSLIVLRDSVGVRRVTRENAYILDKKFKLNRNIREGHSFREIVLGIVLGGIVSALVFVA
jgi:acid phosphatase family membrane protein YuiD